MYEKELKIQKKSEKIRGKYIGIVVWGVLGVGEGGGEGGVVAA